MDITKEMAELLFKLIRRSQWGGKHSDETNLFKGFYDKERKKLQKAKYELIKAGLIIRRPKNGGIHLWLNQKRCKDIYAIAGQYFNLNHYIVARAA